MNVVYIEDVNYTNTQTIDLKFDCQNYWLLTKDESTEGIQVEVFSDVISTGFFSSTSIMGFYLGVCLTIGTLFRTFVMYKADRIFICDARDPTLVRNLIACIYRARLEQNLKKEEEYFFLLFEILRSPELFKHLTKTSIKVELEHTSTANQKQEQAKQIRSQASELRQV